MVPVFADRMGRHGIEAAGQCFGANGAGRSDFGHSLAFNTLPLATMMTFCIMARNFSTKNFSKARPFGRRCQAFCYAMTEKSGGADATGMKTTAIEDGDNYVLNGDKWYISSANVADIAVIMAKPTDAPRHQQFSTFIVELPNPGFTILRNIDTMHRHTPLGSVWVRRIVKLRLKTSSCRSLARRTRARLQYGPTSARQSTTSFSINKSTTGAGYGN